MHTERAAMLRLQVDVQPVLVKDQLLALRGGTVHRAHTREDNFAALQKKSSSSASAKRISFLNCFSAVTYIDFDTMICVLVRLTQVVRVVNFVDVPASIFWPEIDDAGRCLILQTEAKEDADALDHFKLLPSFLFEIVVTSVT